MKSKQSLNLAWLAILNNYVSRKSLPKRCGVVKNDQIFSSHKLQLLLASVNFWGTEHRAPERSICYFFLEFSEVASANRYKSCSYTKIFYSEKANLKSYSLQPQLLVPVPTPQFAVLLRCITWHLMQFYRLWQYMLV